MKKPANININLLPKDPFLTSTAGRFLQWVLTVGRYLVVFTELIVIISFGSRFTLDRRVTDLNTGILQRSTIIASYGDLEGKIREIQKKTESYVQVEQKQSLADAFPALSEITPRDVTLINLTIQPGAVSFSGRTNSTTSLNLLINNLVLSNKFADVSVERLTSGTAQDPGFTFKINATVKAK
jgi:Tfp pilus assembly protein PilN